MANTPCEISYWQKRWEALLLVLRVLAMPPCSICLNRKWRLATSPLSMIMGGWAHLPQWVLGQVRYSLEAC